MTRLRAFVDNPPVLGRIVLAFAFFLTVQTAAVSDLNDAAVRATVMEVAATISREYMDPVVAERLAGSLRRRLTEGEYQTLTTPDALAARLTRDLFAESQDKHLSVAVALESASTTPAAPATNTREQGVRRTNGGVQRVEILTGNVGYLNLTSSGGRRRRAKSSPMPCACCDEPTP